jgi:beta-lactamase class A
MKIPATHNQRHLSHFFSRRSLAISGLFTLGLAIVLISLFLNWPARGVSSARTSMHTGVITRRISLPQERAVFSRATQQAGMVPAPVSLDTLSTKLSSYLATLGSNVGVEVYDETNQRSYSYNGTAQFLTASSIKVPIMLTFLARTESQGREPNGDEMNLLTTMIENSDNDAASALFTIIGGAPGMANYLQQIGLSGLVPNGDAWGYSQITPQAMVTLLTRLHDGTILTATDRATALNLMQHVEADQQWGVGNTAPAGATFAMKNGWVPGPDGLWSVNTSGIVSTGSKTYIISVYTQEQQSLADGQAIVQQVCGTVASTLA